MKNKNLLIGGAVVAGLLFLYLRNRKNADAEERSAGAGLGSVGGGAIAQENGGGAVMQTSQPVVVSTSSATSTPSQGTLRPLRINTPSVSSARPYNTSIGAGLPNIFGSPRPATSTNPQLDLSNRINATLGRSNFLTFDGNIEATSGNLDFEGNLD
jgi:hypothetical protein